MAKEYKWLIENMVCEKTKDELQDVVVLVFWRRVCNDKIGDKDYMRSLAGRLACTNPDPEKFTPYNELTFEEVCNWLDNSINVELIDKSLSEMIDDDINNNEIVLPLPWDI
jgi:hypothetical protein